MYAGHEPMFVPRIREIPASVFRRAGWKAVQAAREFFCADRLLRSVIFGGRRSEARAIPAAMMHDSPDSDYRQNDLC